MLLHLDGADKFFGARRVLAHVTVTVRTGAKIGVVGPNGGGKSTLLRLLAGLEAPDAGGRDTARDVTVGYLGQLVAFAPEHEARTMEQYLRDALQHVDELTTQLRALEEELARPDVQEDAAALEQTLARYAACSARFEQVGGYEADARLRATAFGLGFKAGDLERRVGQLSGGQKVRLALGRLLLSAPDVLLLDEPTNHLDAGTTEWLESFLKQAPQAIVVVSHDRYFLDAVTEQTWDVDNAAVHSYPASYTRALELKLEAMQRQQALHERQRAEIERLEQFVTRYKAGIKARQARGRAAQLERMDRIDAPREQARGPRIALEGTAVAGRTGRETLRIRGVSKSFGERSVLSNVDLVAERGQRIGVTGPNGSGKTTLLRMLAGLLAPDAGAVMRGAGVHVGYFAQGQEDLEPDLTVLDHLLAEHDLTIEAARRHLARFLFFGDEIYASVERLSGGERNRVALARLILHKPNVLLLDEPTNHLDVNARTALEEALAEFDGTIIAVSHDRYFLDTVCNRLWIVDGGAVDTFVGTYSQWAAMKQQEGTDLPPTVAEENSVSASPTASPTTDRNWERRLRQERQRRQRQRDVRIAAIEQEIERLEAKQRDQERLLSDPALYADEEHAKATVLAHEETIATLADLFAEWEQLLSAE